MVTAGKQHRSEHGWPVPLACGVLEQPGPGSSRSPPLVPRPRCMLFAGS